MQSKREVTFTVRRLFNQIRRLADNSLPPGERLAPMQGRFIGYIKHSTGDVYQRDLETEFQIRRSTASAILQTMERNDLIRREPVVQDARLKKLVLTPRAEAYSDRFMLEMARVEALITQGVSTDELEAFFRVAGQFESNLAKYTGGNGGAERPARDVEGKE